MWLPQNQRRTFFAVVLAQFLSSVADNALLIVAIALLTQNQAALWTVPALRIVFYFSYVLLAAHAGQIADAFSKTNIITLTNFIKLCGCILLFVGMHPVLAYTLIGIGSAAYAPAKYGILPELLPTSELVMANAWMETSTIVSVFVGIGLSSFLLENPITALAIPEFGLHSHAELATGLILLIYLAAAIVTLLTPKVNASNPNALQSPGALLSQFYQSAQRLLQDRPAVVALTLTSLFWAVSASLQFLVLRFATETLALSLARAALLQSTVAFGVIIGMLAANQWITLQGALRLLPLGLLLGGLLMLITQVDQIETAALLFVAIGMASGLLLVPMNALLQSRGILLMHAGQSIAVQNFFESLASLGMLALYALLIYAQVTLMQIIVIIAALILLITMLLIKQSHSLAMRFNAQSR
jgi:MFS family permease